MVATTPGPVVMARKKKVALSLVVACRGKTPNEVVAEDGGGAQVKGGALTKLELWSRSSGIDR